MNRSRATGFLLVVVSAVGFGSGTVLSKPIYAAGLDWLQLLAWRFALGAAFAWLWILVSRRRRAAVRRLARRPLLVAIALGIWYSGNAGTYYAGLETVPASLAGVLVSLYPAVVAVLSVRYARRLVGRRPWIALGVALVGVVLALGGIELVPRPSAAGILLVLASPVIYAGWIVLSLRLAGERTDRLAHEATGDGQADDAAAASALMIAAAAAVFVVGGVATGRRLAPDQIPSAAWPFLLAIAFATTFLAIQTFYAGARRIGAAQAALLSTLEPLVILVLSAVALHEVLAPIQLGGAALILVGVVVAQTGRRGAGAPDPAPPFDGPLAPTAGSSSERSAEVEAEASTPPPSSSSSPSSSSPSPAPDVAGD